ncbi:MAG: S8 family peptidase [Bacillota bacterium]
MSKKVSLLLTAIVFTVLLLMVFGNTVSSAAGLTSDAGDRFIVIFDNDASKHAVKNFVRENGGDILAEFSIVPGMAVRLGQDKVSGLEAFKGVKDVGIDGKIYAADAELDNSWGVKRIGAGAVHDAGNKGQGVKIAVIDSGVDYNHPDLDDNYAGGYDFVNNDSDPMDDLGHGTHVTGIIAAEDNDSGVVGVAPEASIYAFKVLGADGSGEWSDFISALQAVYDLTAGGNKVVVNMSVAAEKDAPGVHDAIKAVYEAGAVLVAAAGNSGNRAGAGNSIEYPARYEEVIAVGAVDNTDTRAFFSSTGRQLELAAPGVDVYSCIPGGDYLYASGTSMASPHVAGSAALVLAGDTLTDLDGDGQINNKDVRLRLSQTADDLGRAGWDLQYGYGLVNAAKAALACGTIMVSDISYSTEGWKNKDLIVTVSLVDSNENPVASAYVSARVSRNGIALYSKTGVTGDDGKAVFKIKNAPKGTYTTTVTSVYATGLTWDGKTPDNSYTK